MERVTLKSVTLTSLDSRRKTVGLTFVFEYRNGAYEGTEQLVLGDPNETVDRLIEKILEYGRGMAFMREVPVEGKFYVENREYVGEELAELFVRLGQFFRFTKGRPLTAAEQGDWIGKELAFDAPGPAHTPAEEDELGGMTTRVMNLMRDGLLGSALDTLRQMVLRDPERAWIHERLGECLFRDGKYLEASAEFYAARQRGGATSLHAFEEHGQILFEAKKFLEAIAIYQEGLELYPHTPPLLIGLAHCLYHERKPFRNFLDRAAQKDPEGVRDFLKNKWRFRRLHPSGTRYITVEDAAKQLRISTHELMEEVRKGMIPCQRKKDEFHFVKIDLQAWKEINDAFLK